MRKYHHNIDDDDDDDGKDTTSVAAHLTHISQSGGGGAFRHFPPSVLLCKLAPTERGACRVRGGPRQRGASGTEHQRDCRPLVCRRVSGARRLPTAASGRQQGGEEKTTRYTHTHLRRHRVPAETHTESRRTNAHNWQPAKHRRSIAALCRATRGQVCLPTQAFLETFHSNLPAEVALMLSSGAALSQCPEGGEEKHPQKAGNTVGLFTLLGTGRKRPFSCRMAGDLVKHLAAFNDSCEERLQLEPQRAPAV